MSATTLGDAASSIDYGLSLSSTPEKVGPRFLRITDIDSSHIDWNRVPYCEASISASIKCKLESGDVVVARTGASTGRSQWVDVDEPAVFASYLVRFRFKPEFDSRFVAYVLQTPAWHQFVASVAHGKSAQPNMSASAMAAFQFAAPPLAEQRAIAEVLGALDDKIAANTRLAATADQLASALYQSAILGESAAVRIDELTTLLKRGGAPRYVEESPEAMSVLNQKCVRGKRVDVGLGRWTERARVQPERILLAGDILVNSTGMGTLGRVARWTGSGDATVDSHITVVRFDPSKRDVTVAGQGLLEAEARVEALGEGSTGQTELSRIELGKLEIRLPPVAHDARLGAQLRSLGTKAQTALRENQTLAETRDALLPKLMSGQLRVRDAERIVEAAGA